MSWTGQVVMLTTSASIVPALTTAHYIDGVQADVSAEDADSVDLVTLSRDGTQLTNVLHIDVPTFDDRLRATPNRYFVGEAGDGGGSSVNEPSFLSAWTASETMETDTYFINAELFAYEGYPIGTDITIDDGTITINTSGLYSVFLNAYVSGDVDYGLMGVSGDSNSGFANGFLRYNTTPSDYTSVIGFTSYFPSNTTIEPSVYIHTNSGAWTAIDIELRVAKV